MFDLLWNLSQQREIAQLRTEVNAARRDGGSARDSRIDELERRMDLLALTTMGMWSLVREKLRITDAELESAMNHIDLIDGVADGKMSPPRHCPKCARTLSRRHSRCMYCGTEVGPVL